LRHARFFADRARELTDGDLPPDAADDWEDIGAAAAFAAKEHPHLVLPLALAIDALAHGSGLDSTQLGYLDEALRRGAASDLGLLGRALLVRAGALYGLGRLVEARRDAATSLALATELGDDRRAAAAHLASAQYAYQLGEIETAREHLTKALERGKGVPMTVAAAHCQLGTIHNSLGELEVGRDAFERSLRIVRRAGDVPGEVLGLMGLAWNCFESGDRDAAIQHYERVLVLVRDVRMVRSERIVMGYLGLVHFDAGDLVVAAEHLMRSTTASRRAGDFRIEGIFEGIHGGVLAAQGRIDDARAAFDIADELLARNAFYQRAIAIHRGHLDLAEARVAFDDGHRQLAQAHVATARWRIEEARGLAKRSDDARAAMRILERAIEQNF